MLNNGNGTDTTMLVQPSYSGAPYYGGGGWGGGFGGDWIGLLWLLPILMMFGGGWGGFGMGGMGAGGYGALPWLFASNANTDNLVQGGFNQAATAGSLNGLSGAVASGFGDVQLGIAGLGRDICQTGGQITAAVRDTAAQAEIAAGGRHAATTQQLFNNELNALNRSFAEQSANQAGFNALASQFAQCCCDEKLLTVQTQGLIQAEGAATRAANAEVGHKIMDKLCQLELDGVRSDLEAERRENNNLRTQLSMAGLAASQNAQTAAIERSQEAQTQYIVNRIAPYPQPAVVVGYSGNGCPNGYNNGFGFGGWNYGGFVA